MSNLSVSLEGIIQAIENLNYRTTSPKYKVIHAIKSYYTSEDSIKTVRMIDTDSLIRTIWDLEDNPAGVKSKRRNFFSIRSSIVADLEKLSDKGLNPDHIILTDDNIFDISMDEKNRLLNSFSNAVAAEGIDLEQATGLLKTVSEFLAQLDFAQDDPESKDLIAQIKKILNSLTREVLPDESPVDSQGGKRILKGEDPEGRDAIGGDGQGEGAEEILLDQDTEIEEIDEDTEIEELEEIDEDEELEEIDEDTEIEEIEADDEVEEIDEDLEEIEEIDDLEDDMDLEEVEEIDEETDLEEIEEIDEETEIEETEEIDEDTEIDEIDEDAEIDEIDEDTEIDEIEKIDETDEVLEEIEEIDEIDEDLEEIEEIEADEELEEIDEDEPLEVVDGLDQEELKALEEYRRLKELADHFDNTLGEKEKKYNAYVTVPAGKYTIGTSKGLKNSLELQQFDMPKVYIARYPVTNALFEVFIDETGYVTTAEKVGFGMVFTGRFKKGPTTSFWQKTKGSEKIEKAFWYQPEGPGSSLHHQRNHPVVQVSVDDAFAFSSWVGRRIPTEAEWESAARTDLGYEYPWGNDFRADALNIESSGIGSTKAVDAYDAFANIFRISDFLGNIMEWTSDRELPALTSRQNIKYCVAKGGAWNASDDITISSRGLFRPGFTSNTIGFRCISEIFLN